MMTFYTLTKIEAKLVWRGLDILIFGIIFPIIVALLFGYIMNNELFTQGNTMFHHSYPAVVTISILATGVMGLPLTIADYRHRHILKRFQVTPASPLTLLCAQALVQFIASMLSFLGVTAVYLFVFNYEMAGSFGLFLCSYLFVLMAMYSIGILIGSIVPDQKAANLWGSLAYFGMLLFSGATIPFEIFPQILQNVFAFLPLSQGIQLLKEVSLGGVLSDMIFPIVTMMACVFISGFLSIKYFRWK